MKTIFKFLPLMLLTAGYSISAQERIKQIPSHHFKTTVESAIFECDILGNRTSDSVAHIAPGYSNFAKVGETVDGKWVIIRFWRWDYGNSDQRIDSMANKQLSKGAIRYWLMKKEDFNGKTVPRYSMRASFSSGTIVVPVKARFNQFDFSTDTHLGPSFGTRFRLSPYTPTNFFNALATFGISSVDLDSLNTRGTIMETAGASALSFALGGVFEFSHAQVGFFLGCDFISRNNNINWVYQGKPWASIGLGYSLMSNDGGQNGGTENED